MRVVEAIMYRDEADMLECRLAEHDGVIDHTVLVESRRTHRGDPKPLHFAEDRERFAPWLGKITPVVADLPADLGAWPREHQQRDAAIPALEALGLSGDDIVLIADVDEFPPRGFDWATINPVVSFAQTLAMYAVDLLYPEPHVCSVAARWGVLKGKSLAAVRDNRHAYRIVRGGWHLTWLGGPEGQRVKLAVTCHEEMTELSKELLASGRCYTEGLHHTGDFRMTAVDVDDTWPGKIARHEMPESWYRPPSEQLA